jgi:hypothetical protein
MTKDKVVGICGDVDKSAMYQVRMPNLEEKKKNSEEFDESALVIPDHPNDVQRK